MGKSYPKRENFYLGRIAASIGSNVARCHFDASKGRTHYHKQRYVASSLLFIRLDFHPGPHGGLSYVSPAKQLRTGLNYHLIALFLWTKCQKEPTTRLNGYQRYIEKKLNIPISLTTVSCRLSWNRKPTVTREYNKLVWSRTLCYPGNVTHELSLLDLLQLFFRDQLEAWRAQ